jgi:D-amino-acid dehydrogenase
MHVLVIGSGLIGTATAWYLCREGADVTVVDRASGPARETSYANAGMLTPSMADPWNAPGVHWKLLGWLGRDDAPMLLRSREIPRLAGWGLRFLWNSRPAPYRRNMLKNLALASDSIEGLRALRAELGLSYCERSLGTLKVFRDPESLDHAITVAGWLGEHGLVHRPLDRDGVVAAEPSLAPVAEALAGGILNPEDESGDARLFVEGLARAAEGAGVEFLFDTRVSGLRVEGGRVVCAATSAGDLDPDAIVVAAGSDSPGLLSGLGIDLPVRPVKGYSITVPCPDPALGPSRPVTDDTLHIAVTPFGDRLRVAGTAEFAGHDRSVGTARIANLRLMLRETFPACATSLGADETLSPWSGLRPMSADGVPVLGRTRYENLFLNTGHGHLGWTMAVGSGRAVARLVTGGQPGLPLEPYGIGRFHGGRPG